MEGFVTGVQCKEADENIKLCLKELEAYFAHRLMTFSVKLKIKATLRGESVPYLSEISYGETLTYKEIACSAGNSLAKNPLLIIVPCHRVVSSRGMGGHAGGLTMKKELILLEDASFYRSFFLTSYPYR